MVVPLLVLELPLLREVLAAATHLLLAALALVDFLPLLEQINLVFFSAETHDALQRVYVLLVWFALTLHLDLV